MDRAVLTIHFHEGPRVIPVLFNPTEYTIARNMKYAPVGIPGLEMPILQFIRGESRTLRLELFLDGSDRSPFPSPAPHGSPVEGAQGPKVHDRLQALRKLVTIDGHLHAPPVVQFVWGDTAFVGVTASYSERFTMFDEEGEIERARVSLELTSYSSGEELYREADPHSPDRTKTRVARTGDRLDRIAAEEYGDPSLWPAIARANNIARPRMLQPGTLLVVPPLD